jgi:hypothetical protein
MRQFFLPALVLAGCLSLPAVAQPAPSAAPKTYTLTVTSDELGVIGQALGETPTRVGMPVVQRLRDQVSQQDKKRDAPPPPAAPAAPQTPPPPRGAHLGPQPGLAAGAAAQAPQPAPQPADKPDQDAPQKSTE